MHGVKNITKLIYLIRIITIGILADVFVQVFVIIIFNFCAYCNPDFFYIYNGDKKLASIILNGGEKVKLKLDTLGNNLSVEGYEEAVKLAESEKTFTNAVKKFDSLAVVFTNAKASGDTAAERAANLKLGSLYVKYKQAAMKSLYQNPKSITNVYLLYQKFPGELPVFGSNMDGLLFKRVYDSLAVVYPESKYLPMLKKESEDRQKYNDSATIVTGKQIGRAHV